MSTITTSTVTPDQFAKMIRDAAPRKQEPSKRGGSNHAWGAEAFYTYDGGRSLWVLPALLFDRLPKENVSQDGSSQYFTVYTSSEAATAALATARDKLHEDVGRASDRVPHDSYGDGSHWWWHSDRPATDKSHPPSVLAVARYDRLTGHRDRNEHRVSYATQAEAYRALGRLMCEEAGERPPAQPVIPEVKEQPVNETKPIEAKTETTDTTKTEAPAYSPWPGAQGAFWHKDQAVYGAASLPAALFARLPKGTTAADTWVYYDTVSAAVDALRAAQGPPAGSGVTPAQTPAPAPVPFPSASWFYFQCAGDERLFTGKDADAAVVPDDVLAELCGRQRRSGYKSHTGVWVCYDSETEAKAAYAEAVAVLKERAGAPPAPAVPGREPSYGGVYWYFQSQARFARSPVGSGTGRELSVVPDDVLAELCRTHPVGAGRCFPSEFSAYDSAAEAKAAYEAAKKAVAKALVGAKVEVETKIETGPKSPAPAHQQLAGTDWYYWASLGYRYMGAATGIEESRIPLAVVQKMKGAPGLRELKDYAATRDGWVAIFYDRAQAVAAYEAAKKAVAADEAAEVLAKAKEAVKTAKLSARAYEPHVGSAGNYHWTTFEKPGDWVAQKPESMLPDDVWLALKGNRAGTSSLDAAERWKGYATKNDAMAALYKALEIAGPREPAPFTENNAKRMWLSPASQDIGAGKNPVVRALCRLPDALMSKLYTTTGAHPAHRESAYGMWAMYHSAEEAVAAYEAAKKAVEEDAARAQRVKDETAAKEKEKEKEKEKQKAAADALVAARKALADAKDDRRPAQHSNGLWYWTAPGYTFMGSVLANAKESAIPVEVLSRLKEPVEAAASWKHYPTELAALTAYLAAKGEYAKQQKADEDARLAVKFPKDKGPYPAQEGTYPNGVWGTTAWAAGYYPTTGRDTCRVSRELLDVMWGDGTSAFRDTYNNPPRWVNYKDVPAALAAYEAAEKVLADRKAAEAEKAAKTPAPKYVACDQGSACFTFWLGGNSYGNYISHPPSQIPAELFARLTNFATEKPDYSKTYSSAAAAAKALEEAEKAPAESQKPKYEAKNNGHQNFVFWLRGYGYTDHPQSQLPRELFDELRGQRDFRETWKNYTTAEDAAKALAEAEARLAEKVAAKAESAYKPVKRVDGQFVWIHADHYKLGGWSVPGADAAKLPAALFGKLTGGNQVHVKSGNTWRGYEIEEAALAALADAQILVRLTDQAVTKIVAAVISADQAAEPEVKPVEEPYAALRSGNYWYWIDHSQTATGWQKGFEKARVPHPLFVLLKGGHRKINTPGNSFVEYKSEADAKADLAAARELAAAGLAAKTKPGRGSTWKRNEGTRASAPEVSYVVLSTDETKGEVVLRKSVTKTIVVTTDAFVREFCAPAEFEAAGAIRVDENGNPRL